MISAFFSFAYHGPTSLKKERNSSEKKLFSLKKASLKSEKESRKNICTAGNSYTAFLYTRSIEIDSLTGIVDYEVVVYALDTTYIDSISFVDTSGYLNTTMKTSFDKTYLLKGDSAIATLTTTYDSASLPYYPRSVNIDLYIHDLNDDSAVYHTKALFYFTPYNSLEIWDVDDFLDLPRHWEQPQLTEPQRIYYSKNQLAGDTITIDSANAWWQMKYRWKHLAGLPYAIALKAEHPDSTTARLLADSIADANGDDGGNNMRSSHSNIYSFNLKGKITTDLLIDEIVTSNNPAKNDHILLGLGGLTVRLFEQDPGFDDVIGVTHTLQDGTYEFNIDNAHFSGEGGTLELYIQVESATEDGKVICYRRMWYNSREMEFVDTKNNLIYIDEGTKRYPSDLNLEIKTENRGMFQAVHYANNAVKFMSLYYNDSYGINDLHLVKYNKHSWIGASVDHPKGVSSHYESYGQSKLFLTPGNDICPGDDQLEGVVYHEFGHHVWWMLENHDVPSTQNHPWNKATLELEAAWSEGWGYGFEGIMDLYYKEQDGEYEICRAIPPESGSKIIKNKNLEWRDKDIYKIGSLNGLQAEYFIATMIYDLYDGPNPDHATFSMNYADYADDKQSSNGSNTSGYIEGLDEVQLTFNEICDVFIDIRNNNWPHEEFNVSSYMRWLIMKAAQNNDWDRIKKLRVVFEQNGLLKGVPIQYKLNDKNIGDDFDYNLYGDINSQVSYSNSLGTDELGGAFMVFSSAGSNEHNNLLFYDIPEPTSGWPNFMLNNLGTSPASNTYIEFNCKGFLQNKKWISDPVTISDRNLLINEVDATNAHVHTPVTLYNDLEVHQIANVTLQGTTLSIGKDATATYYIESGSTLDLDGNLKIYDNSSLVVKKGGRLLIHQYPQIPFGTNELNGDNAMIVIEDGGILEIADNATFTFTKASGFSSSGRIKFIKNISYDATGKMIYPTNIKAGSHSKFVLEGNSTAGDDVILEVTGEEYVMPDNNLELFSIKNGQVSLGDNCRVVAGGPFTMENVRITTTNNSANDPMHRGLHLFGQLGVTIKNSTIKYGKTGIFAPLYNSGNMLTIDNLKMENCTIGMYTKGAGVNILEAKMYYCKTGWQADEAYFDSKVNQVEIKGVPTGSTNDSRYKNGIIYKSYGSSSLSVTNSYMYNLYNDGIQYTSGPSLSVQCSEIYNNTENGITFNGGSLNLSPDISPNAGNNKLTNNKYALNIYSCDNLLLNNGKNILTSKTNSNNKITDIKAFTSSYYFYNSINNTVGIWPIQANSNTWGANNAVANIPSSNASVLVDIEPNVGFPSPNNNNVYYIPITDISPFSGTRTCPSVTWHNNPLAPVRTTGNIINITTTSFNNMRLDLALNNALNTLYVSKNYTLAITKLSEILGYGYPTTITGGTCTEPTCLNVENVELLKLTYSKMMEALSVGLSVDSIKVIRGQTAPESVVKVLTAITDLISDLGSTHTTATYPKRLQYTFDKAFIYRLAEDRPNALSVLSSMSWADSLNGLWRDYYICSFSKEDSSIHNQIPIAALYTKLAMCAKPTQADSSGAYAPISSSLTNEHLTEQNSMVLYPNPTEGDVQVKLTIENDAPIKAMLIDMLGRPVYTNTFSGQSGSNIYNISLPELSNGIYLFKVEVLGKQYIDKLTIRK